MGNIKFTKKSFKKSLEITERETDQAVEGLYHNLNTLQSRSGNQLPFTSINYGTDTSTEGRLATKAILKGSMNGVGRYHKTPIFPCGIFQWSKSLNAYEGTPNYDLFKLALQSTAKRLYPNYANTDWSSQTKAVETDRNFKKSVIESLSQEDLDKLCDLLRSNKELQEFFFMLIPDTVDGKNVITVSYEQHPEEIFSTMGCRTANGYDCNAEDSFKKNIEYILSGKGLYDDVKSGAIKDGRGNIAPATLILPKLAMIAKGKTQEGESVEDVFLDILDKKLSECRDQLIERFEYICSQNASSAKFMYDNHIMIGYVPEEGIRSALRHGTLAIGQLGLAECLKILVGCYHTEEKGMAFAHKIEGLIRKRADEFKKETRLNFGVYYTPAENLCYTAMSKFKTKYGVIEGVSDKDFFTNSMHIPVWIEMDPFEKIDLEAQLTGYSNAGCITYVEVDSTIQNNLEALESIVNYAMEKDIPYFAVNVPNDTCMSCGYTGEFDKECPMCGGKDIRHLRRVTGYLTGDYLENFNDGKIQETKMRVKHWRSI